MANLFLNLPAPAANAAGAGVDVSAMGASKSLVISGSWGLTLTPIITIEINNDPAQAGSWVAIGSTQGGGTFEAVVCCKWMRARVSGYQGGPAPSVNVGSDDVGTVFAALDVPVGNGPGTWIDVSALPGLKTIQVGGAFQGAVIIEVSEDGQTSSASLLSFQSATPGQQTLPYVAHWMRARRSGVPVIGPGTPVVNVGACDIGGGGGGGTVTTNDTLTGDGVVPLGVVAPNQADVINDEVAPVPPGTPVYIDAPGGFKKAKADAAATVPVFGLTIAAVNAAASGVVQTGGVLELTTAQWDVICGTVGGLTFDIPYYLDAVTAGKLTAVQPAAALVIPVIFALSTTKALVLCGPNAGVAGSLWVVGAGAGSVLQNNGSGNLAAGAQALAAGSGTSASGKSSAAFGDRALATREAQISHASGRFAANGDAQSWSVELRGSTPGAAPGETVELMFGEAANQTLQLEDGKGYTFTVTATAKDTVAGGKGVQSFVQRFAVRRVAGLTVIDGIGAVDQFGNAASATWTLVASVGAAPDRFVLTFATTGAQAAARCVARVDVVEVLNA